MHAEIEMLEGERREGGEKVEGGGGGVLIYPVVKGHGGEGGGEGRCPAINQTQPV